MIRRFCVLSLPLALAISAFTLPQSPPPVSPAETEYPQEAAVIEEMSTKIDFDNDGNSKREQLSRIRVKTDAGVQAWGLLSFPFQSASQVLDIDFVRVRKPDGTTVVTSSENVQDLDAEITRSAPFYSDLREKHVAVKGLAKGDVLEYAAHWRTTKPLTPGQFWFVYNFHHDGIVLKESIAIKVPRDRAVKVKGPQATQSVTTDADSRIYSWTYSKLQTTNEGQNEQKKLTEAALGRLPPPDVQISSFQSWEEVGRWYWSLQKERVEPTAAIRAKAAELTKGLTDDVAKLNALYNFVSMQYRYIGIAFGIGRYQPHAADDILTNNYGDCKDKHTLLASLLQASGISLYPALINSGSQLDPDVPSPGQFDHLIGYLPQNPGPVWIDTTPEVAPFGLLIPRLRNKPALVVKGEKSAQLINTPADPPFTGTQNFQIDGKLSDEGTLEAKVEYTVRGDSELNMRGAFRRTPQSQWKDLVQQISYALGYAGTVKDITASSAETTTDPFHFSYSYNRKDYPDWTNHQFTIPGHPFYMPLAKDETKDPIWLGAPLEMISNSKVELPTGYKPQVPANVDLKYDFAEYHASYSADRNVFTAKRQLVVKLREVPVAELEDYRDFLKSLRRDLDQYVMAASASGTGTADTSLGRTVPPFINGGSRLPPLLNGVWQLPDSDSVNANRLESEARDAVKTQTPSDTASAFKRAVEADPKFTRAWLELAIVTMSSGQIDSALGYFQKAVDVDPKQVFPRKIYAFVLGTLLKTDAAIDAWHEAEKLAPDDWQIKSELGALLMQKKRYNEALPYLETIGTNDQSYGAQNRLGVAYLRAGQTEKGIAILERLVGPEAKPGVWNDIAYELADSNVSLPKALEYAQRAVQEQEMESQQVDLSNLAPENLACTQRLANFWDTLGWVHFRLGNLHDAESYLYAAWLLDQSAVVADHLGQVYAQQKKTAKAIHMYQLALATPEAHVPDDSWDETRHRLSELTGKKAPTAIELLRGDPNGTELSGLRTVKLKRLVTGSAEADFFVLFAPGPKIEALEFVSGSQKLRSAGQALSSANFQVTFPEGSSAKLVRRGILMCSDISGCQAVLFTPKSVKSVN